MSSACPQNSPAKDIGSSCGFLVPLKILLLQGVVGWARTGTFFSIWLEALSFGEGESGLCGGYGVGLGIRVVISQV